ncbi:MAG TPA: aspartate aminotransferase family protein, partial [Acidimicrobiales bacterium]|nr:aspartate aminotransferase family protein [Acidimicrobiales bacterium]
MSSYPYEDRFPVIRTFPETGRPRDEILADVEWMGAQEDRSWNQGHCSGTMYCGDVDHYAFLNRVFAAFSHVNALQRDICPSVTKFEAEITAMTLDMLHGEGAEDPCGSITGGGTDS